jgi:hypothetical protein
LSLSIQFRPLSIWPGKRTSLRTAARFKASYPDTLSLLETELDKLNAKQVIIQAGFQLNEIRVDGWPKSSARPKDPGVILSFQSQNGPLSFSVRHIHRLGRQFTRDCEVSRSAPDGGPLWRNARQ